MTNPSGLKRPWAAIALGLSALLNTTTKVAAKPESVYIEGKGEDGITRQLPVSRTPALYTGDFDDCMGGESLFNVTKFDAAFYRDNMTMLFHLDGTTNIGSDNLIMYISVDAYGENRFNMTYDPCKADIPSLCPVNKDTPIEAFAVINITHNDIAGISPIALGIPDLEGYARMHIFSNSTQTLIGCFQAPMTNGQSFSQPLAVGTLIGGFTFLAVLGSFFTAIYGVSIPHMRMHYAHSFSVLVAFETFQSIFFLGALSVNWPSVLPAWWSNFAWTAGMFASQDMTNSISSFAGVSGNASQVGGAGSSAINNAGGLTQQIYGMRAAESLREESFPASIIVRRREFNASDPYEYSWSGFPRHPGLPQSGTHPGFGGTLSAVEIPAPEAFTLGLIWLLVVIGAVALFVVAFKLILDILVKIRLMKTDGFDYFRAHLGGYVMSGVLRSLFIASFSTMTLCTYQLSSSGPAGPTAIAAIVFIIFVCGMGGVIAYACWFRLREGKTSIVPDTLRVEKGTIFGKVPFIFFVRGSSCTNDEQAERPYLYTTFPSYQIKHIANDPNRPTVHQDLGFVKRFGWLSARYRRTKWWFFAFYFAYQFVRAVIIGGGSQNPTAQVYALFVFEVFSLVIVMKLSPFEGSRNTAVSVWFLSICKILTTGLSIAFLPAFGASRIITTVLGIIIVIVQGFMAVTVLVLITLGLFSTWLSLTRNREQFRPEVLDQTRIKYYERMEKRAGDLPITAVKEEDAEPEPVAMYFNVKTVRRAPKIEDEDDEAEGMHQFPDLEPSGPQAEAGFAPPNPPRRNRTNSASSHYSTSSLPRAARVHRASWSSRDFAQWDAEMTRSDGTRTGHSRSNSLRMQSAKHLSLSGPTRLAPAREVSEDYIATIARATDEAKDGGGSIKQGPTTNLGPETPVVAGSEGGQGRQGGISTVESGAESDQPSPATSEESNTNNST